MSPLQRATASLACGPTRLVYQGLSLDGAPSCRYDTGGTLRLVLQAILAKTDRPITVDRGTARTCSWVLVAVLGVPERSGSFPRPEWGCQRASGLADHLAEAGAELNAPSASTIELGEQSFTFTDPVEPPVRELRDCGDSCCRQCSVRFSVADGEDWAAGLELARVGVGNYDEGGG